MKKDELKLLWVTNHPKSVKGMWPRRAGVDYIEGSPKGTHMYSSDELRRQNIIGVYVDMSPEDYYSLPVVCSPSELKGHEERKV